MTAQTSVPGPVLLYSLYLKSAQGQFPLHHCFGSKDAAILRNGWIFPIGGVFFEKDLQSMGLRCQVYLQVVFICFYLLL